MRFECSLEEYKKYKLGELVENVVAGATPKTSVDDYWNGGDIPWLSSGEVHKKFIYFTDKFITSEGYNNSSTKIVPTNSVLIALAGQGKTRGTVAINKIELCTNQSIASIIPNEMLNYKYLFYYLESKYEYLRALSSSDGGRGGLNLKLIRSIPIQVPSIKEQENISNFINEIDKKILLLEQKHKLYDDFKKYLMQQIFTQKLRFDFSDEWKIVKLESLIKKGKAGGTPSSTNSDYYNGDIPFLSIRDMTDQGKYIVKTEKTITEEGLNNSSAWIIPKNSLLYSIYASIGLVAINRSDISTSQAIYGIILKDGVSLEYMYYYLTYFKKNIYKYIETGTQGNLNAKLLKSFEILLPSLGEQEMIVNVLSIVDEKIENSKKEIEKINEFKKGLLQQMFVVRINWRCNFKLVKSPSFNKHLLILKNKIIFIIIK